MDWLVGWVGGVWCEVCGGRVLVILWGFLVRPSCSEERLCVDVDSVREITWQLWSFLGHALIDGPLVVVLERRLGY